MFALAKRANLNQLVHGGQLYRAFQLSKSSLVRATDTDKDFIYKPIEKSTNAKLMALSAKKHQLNCVCFGQSISMIIILKFQLMLESTLGAESPYGVHSQTSKNIDCLSHLVCLISTVNGCSNKIKEKKKLTLGRLALVAGT